MVVKHFNHMVHIINKSRSWGQVPETVWDKMQNYYQNSQKYAHMYPINIAMQLRGDLTI